ncbi:hypothetical protein JCM8097_004567 [Rhodosporidiobolus ruineniae]
MSTRPPSSALPSSPPAQAPPPAPPLVHPPPPPPPDLFVLVRPPPSKAAHPLSCQLQLLVPSTSRRPPSVVSSATGGARSLEAIAGASVSRDGSLGAGAELEPSRSGEDGGATGLSRSPSVSSTRSGRSTRSTRSGTSMSGVSLAESDATGASTTTGGGGRRRKVTPLLNLTFHSVLPTVITDAGTDQRVAKFLKRGVELTGLAVFDPVELSSLAPAPPTFVSSSSSANTGGASTPKAARTAQPAQQTTPQASGGFLGKFKKLAFSSSPSSASPSSGSPSSSSNSPSGSGSKFLASLTSSPLSSSSDAPLPGALPLIRTPSDSTSSARARSPSPSVAAAEAREGYAFLPRRWVRDDLADSAPRGAAGGLRIEWARPERRRGSATSTGLRKRAGTVRSREKVLAPASDQEGEGGGDGSEGEDSDPEDSEREWVCMLVYPLSSAGGGSGGSLSVAGEAQPRASVSSSRSGAAPSPSPPLSSSADGPALAPPSASSRTKLRRLHLATLRPAPHHPKLISTLLLPPSLPSIPLGSFSPAHGLIGGSLSPAELRDLAMTTAMWVAVREGLGGLGGEEQVREEAGRSTLGVRVGAVGVHTGQGGAGKKEGGGKRFSLFGR